MSKSEISGVSETANGVDEFIQSTEQVSRDSQMNEEFYKIRAVNEDGYMNVEITTINVTVEYTLQAKITNPRVRTQSTFETVTLSDEPKENIEDIELDTSLPENTHNLGYACVVPIPKITIYFKTPYQKLYKQVCRRNLNPQIDKLSTFFKNLRTELSESGIATVDDISPLNTLSTVVKVEENIEDGNLVVSEGELNLDATQVEQTISEKSNTAVIDTYKESTEENKGWTKGYISDIRGDVEDGIIGLVVQTPLHKTVFPFGLNYDEDGQIWKLINRNGGTLQDLRGLDILVRERYSRLQDFPSDFELSEQNMPEDITNITKIFAGYKKANSSIESEDVISLGTDVNYVWEMGIPESETEKQLEGSSLLDSLSPF